MNYAFFQKQMLKSVLNLNCFKDIKNIRRESYGFRSEQSNNLDSHHYHETPTH
jgi:hypothetical protein